MTLHYVPTEEENDAAIEESMKQHAIRELEYEIECLKMEYDSYCLQFAYDLELEIASKLAIARKRLAEFRS